MKMVECKNHFESASILVSEEYQQRIISKFSRQIFNESMMEEVTSLVASELYDHTLKIMVNNTMKETIEQEKQIAKDLHE